MENRIYKFRAWQENTKMMHYNNIFLRFDGKLINWDYNGEFVCKNLISLQYTGFIDKKGKEIYEGDIVKGKTDIEGEFTGEVFYDEEEGMWKHTYSDRPPKSFWKLVEVIGNIYEK